MSISYALAFGKQIALFTFYFRPIHEETWNDWWIYISWSVSCDSNCNGQNVNLSYKQVFFVCLPFSWCWLLTCNKCVDKTPRKCTYHYSPLLLEKRKQVSSRGKIRAEYTWIHMPIFLNEIQRIVWTYYVIALSVSYQRHFAPWNNGKTLGKFMWSNK